MSGRPLIEVLFEEDMPTKPDTFAARLQRLRTEAGLSVADLAERAGIHRNAVYMLEAGQRQPSLETARKLARALGNGLTLWD